MTRLTPEQIAAIAERAEKATAAEMLQFVRYKHGGGRAFWLSVNGLRELAIDVYDEANREFYFSVRADVPALLADIAEADREIAQWKTQCDMIRAQARKDNIRAELADQYEQWLLDLGRISGCGHVDERLPRCIEEEFEKLKAALITARESGHREGMKEAARICDRLEAEAEWLSAKCQHRQAAAEIRKAAK